ncbi:MAG: penicillin-binding transpeptidase domain-containing protein [Chloroflexi bacterium]|nr:penicillin-binding transpeptidase domain-containing protein [Chloroflexota bacterium]
MKLNPETQAISSRAILRLASILFLGFFGLSLTLVFWQVFQASTIGNSPSNPRTVLALRTILRGEIFDRNGVPLVVNQSHPQGTVSQRYMLPSLAQVIGYNSSRYGRTGLESSFNQYLDGSVGVVPGFSALEKLLGILQRGDALTLTIDAKLQQSAARLLGQHRGAIIVLDPKTGAILAMVSTPYFDPNNLNAKWKTLVADPYRPLLNRATQAVYPPGSVFKLVTAAAALETGLETPTSQFTCFGDWVIQGFHISCENSQIPPQLTFQRALELSANAIYAQVAYRLGSQTLERYAQRFGFGAVPPIGLPVTPSTLKDAGAPWTGPLLASTGFGQGQLQVTTLQLALITEAIANGGVIMTPYLVDHATSPQGVIVYQHTPEPWRRAISTQTASTLTQMMVGVVNAGSGYNARIPGIAVAGKTGTAQVGGTAKPHAVFVCFAPAQNPQLAVVVLVENSGEGADVAAPIARTLLEEGLKR